MTKCLMMTHLNLYRYLPEVSEQLLYCRILISICRNSTCLLDGSRDPECPETSHKSAREGQSVCVHSFLWRNELDGEKHIKVSVSPTRHVTSHSHAKELL